MTMTTLDFDLDDRYTSVDTPDLTEPEELEPEEDDEPAPQPEAEEEVLLGGDVYLARGVAVFLGFCGLVALVFSLGRWGWAGLITAAAALLYAQVAAWADRREASP